MLKQNKTYQVTNQFEVGKPLGSVLVWTAATCRRFPTGRHVCQFQSAVMLAHSKSGRNQPVGAICHGPWTIVEAGAVEFPWLRHSRQRPGVRRPSGAFG